MEDAKPLHYISIKDKQEYTLKPEDYGHGKTPSVMVYRKIRRLGEGTYGVVYEGEHRETRERVALKRMNVTKDRGVPESVLREIMTLKKLKHDNIVNLITTCATQSYDGIFVVMEYCETDLGRLLSSLKHPLSPAQVKCIMLQLFRAVEFIHSKFYLHRDIKPANILMKQDGILKLADFGLARAYSTQILMTPRVVTLWYRSMELLLGSKKQNHGVDIWSCGCILAELVLGTPLFQANGELQMVKGIIDILGVPTTEIWPDLETMPLFENFQLTGSNSSRLSKFFENDSRDVFLLVQDCLIYDPERRIEAAAVLQHDYFKNDPPPCRASMIPVPLRDK